MSTSNVRIVADSNEELLNMVGEMLNVDIVNFENIRHRLILRAIPAEKAEEGTIYKTVGDIALACYILLNGFDSSQEIISVKVDERMLELWNKSKEEVLRVCELNTLMNFKPVFVDIVHPESLFLIYVTKSFMDDDYVFPYEEVPQCGLCVTCKKHLNGSIAIFLPGVKEAVYKYLERDYYIVFTSIHEAMVCKVDDDDQYEYMAMKEILLSVLKEATAPDEVLTTKVYRYSHQQNAVVEVI